MTKKTSKTTIAPESSPQPDTAQQHSTTQNTSVSTLPDTNQQDTSKTKNFSGFKDCYQRMKLMTVSLPAFAITFFASSLETMVPTIEDQTAVQILDAWILKFCDYIDSKSHVYLSSVSSKADAIKDNVASASKKLQQSYSETMVTTSNKVGDFTTCVEDKCSEVRGNIMSKADSVTSSVQSKYVEISEKSTNYSVAIQLKVAEIKSIASDTVQEVKDEVNKEGVIKVSSKACKVVKDQAIHACNTVRRDGTMALVQNVKHALEEALTIDEVTTDSKAPEVAEEK